MLLRPTVTKVDEHGTGKVEGTLPTTARGMKDQTVYQRLSKNVTQTVIQIFVFFYGWPAHCLFHPVSVNGVLMP